MYGSKFGQFIRDHLSFDTCMGTLVHKSIVRLICVQPACRVFTQKLVPPNIDYCVLLAGRSPCWQYIIALREGFPHQHWLGYRGNQTIFFPSTHDNISLIVTVQKCTAPSPHSSRRGPYLFSYNHYTTPGHFLMFILSCTVFLFNTKLFCIILFNKELIK